MVSKEKEEKPFTVQLDAGGKFSFKGDLNTTYQIYEVSKIIW